MDGWNRDSTSAATFIKDLQLRILSGDASNVGRD